MQIIGGGMHNYCDCIQKKLGPIIGEDSLNVYGIYQKRHYKGRTYCLRMNFYEPTNPRTAFQQSNRNKFRAAIRAWQLLTEEQKEPYNVIAKYKNYSGYNLFIHNYMISH